MSDARHDERSARLQADRYTIELAPLIDGNVFVSVEATVPKGEDDIASETLTSRIVPTLADALNVIGAAVFEAYCSIEHAVPSDLQFGLPVAPLELS